MDHAEYRRLRRQLDEELRAGIEMLRAGHRAKVEALEELWMEPAVEVPAVLPAVREEEPVEAGVEPPDGRRSPGEIRAEVETALAKLGEVFEKGDLCRALGYEPRRSSLHRVIEEMLDDGALEVETAGSGRRPTRYRRGRQANVHS